MALDDLLDKAKEAASAVGDKVSEIKTSLMGEEQQEIEEEFKENSGGKLKEVVEQIQNSLSLITRSGYEFKGIGANIGLSLSITLSFHYKKEITEDERSALLEEASDKKLIKLILKLLFKAGDFYKSIQLGDYQLDVVNISLGLSPGMSVAFKKSS